MIRASAVAQIPPYFVFSLHSRKSTHFNCATQLHPTISIRTA